MKKLAMALALTASMAIAGVCAAAGEGTILNKDQKVAETLYAGLNGSAEVTYEQAVATLVPELKTKVTEQAFSGLQKNVKEKLGSCKEVTFRTFDHFNDGDRVVYVGKYSKEETVAMVFVFNPEGKIINFALNPVKPQQAKPAEAPAEAPAEE